MKKVQIFMSAGRHILLVVLCVLFINLPALASAPTDENGAGNHDNGMLALLHQGNLYYSNFYDKGNIYIAEIAGYGDEFLCEINAHKNNPLCKIMGMYEDWLYYCNGDDQFYRINTISGKREQLVNSRKLYANSGIQVIGGALYFLGPYCDDNGWADNLWGMNSDGGFLASVPGVKAWSFVSDGQYIYYASMNDQLVRLNPKDYTQNTFMINSRISSLNVIGNMLYFARNGQLMKMRTYGVGLTQIGNARGYYVNVIGDWVYYNNIDDNGKLYRITTDGLDNEKLCDIEDVNYINIAGGWVYFLQIEDRDDGDYMIDAYKIRLDGSDLMLTKQASENSQQQPADQQKQLALASAPTDGNGASNQNNWMLALLHQGDIYYSNHYDLYNIYIENTSDGDDALVAKTGGDPSCNIMGAYQNWLYYCDGDTFYRLDTSNGKREKLENGQKVYARSGIQVVKVVSDMISFKIYFLSNTRNSDGEYVDNLWGMNMNGAFLHKVQGVKASSFVSDGQYIYYIDVDKQAIMRFNPANNAKYTLLKNSVVNELNLVGNMLYFIRDGQLMKMSIFGTLLTQIGDVRGIYVNVIGDWIYYANSEDNRKLYRITTDGLYAEKLCDVEDVCYINIAGGWVYFLEYKNRDGWATFPNAYKIRLDGSGLTLAQP